MNPKARYQPLNDPGTGCADSVTAAERELSAFFNVIMQSFGSEQAQRSAEDWLQELIEIDDLPASPREWRMITAKAAIRLASRVSASSIATSLSREPQLV